MSERLDKAQSGTPEAVRRAFYPGECTVGRYKISDVTVATLWLLQDLDHPMASEDATRRNKISPQDMAQLIVVLIDPIEARHLIDAGKLQERAFEVATNVTLPQLSEITARVGRQIRDLLAAAPHTGGSAGSGDEKEESAEGNF